MIKICRKLACMLSVLAPAVCWGQDSEVARTATAPQTAAQVSYADLRNAHQTPHNWLMYSGGYHGHRYSQLAQINTHNAAQLDVQWVRQFPMSAPFESTPLVVDGIMYVTLPENQVVALDAVTGLPYWHHRRELENPLAICCGKINRGVAILGETLYMGTLDAKLVALDARSGQERWQVAVGNPAEGHSITAAPLVVKDMVITGIAGGEMGIRGFIDAYDAKTKERRWRVKTIPEPGEANHESWAGDSWQHGGAPTWMTGSYDPELNLVYWGVGNPGPDYNGDVREGNNLYSDCVLAIDPDQGIIKWHFQFTPHDVHDWDACQVPVLADLEFEGQLRKLLLWPNRNAFYYVLDRESGTFLHARAFAKQTWAKEIDATGRPVVLPGTSPTPEGVLVYPDISGAANWWSPSFSPKTNLLYQIAFDGACLYTMEEDLEPPRGGFYMGGTGIANEWNEIVDSEYISEVRALEPVTGELVWKYPIQAKSTSGLLSTAGNVVFGGTRFGNFFALDATNGNELWRLDLGGWVHAAPITFAVDGKQYVTIAAGHSLYTLGLDSR